MDNINNNEYAFNWKEINKLFNIKASSRSAIHRVFTFQHPRNINNDNLKIIIAQSSSTRTKLILEPIPQFKLSKGNGYVSFRKIPAGTEIDINDYTKKKTKSFDFGIEVKDIQFNISTDGEMENISKNVVSKLSHDIIVMEIKGENKLFGKQMLTPCVSYLEIDRRLEKKIYERELKKDMEEFDDIYDLTEEDGIYECLNEFRMRKNQFKKHNNYIKNIFK